MRTPDTHKKKFWKIVTLCCRADQVYKVRGKYFNVLLKMLFHILLSREQSWHIFLFFVWHGGFLSAAVHPNKFSLHLQPYILKAKSLRSLLFSHKISAEKVRKFQHEHFATKVRKLIKSLQWSAHLNICTFVHLQCYVVEVCSSARLQKKANSFTNNQKRSAKETSYKEWKLCKYFF